MYFCIVNKNRTDRTDFRKQVRESKMTTATLNYSTREINRTFKITVAARTSTRDYVAATANGEFFFGRVDLIGKGDHGKALRVFENYLANPKKEYAKIINSYVPSYRKKIMQEYTYEDYVADMEERRERYGELQKIAYLQR